MPVTTIANKATTQVKTGAGILEQIVIANAGTSWTLQLNDGPSLTAAAFTPLIGATAMTIPAVGTMLLTRPMPFSYGLQIVTAGTTAGEIELQWS